MTGCQLFYSEIDSIL